MAELRAVTRDGDIKGIQLAAVRALAQDLRGVLLAPETAGYESARRIWNGMIDRRPALIARCRGTADVVRALAFAREHELLISVRGGGHNVAGNAVCDGGLMIDLAEMRGVQVDPAARRARAAGGATWGDFDAETQCFGLATPGGLISGTGVAGLTLGGGMGWLSPSYGLACDNLAAVQVVTAEGAVVTASDAENSDLFWGLKGGGGNFGIATCFEFELHPVGPLLFGGMTLHTLDGALAVLREFVEFEAQAPDAVAAVAGFTTTPAGMPALALVAVYNGPVAEGEAALAPLRRIGKPMHDGFGATPYRKLQTLFDAGAPPGMRYYWKSSFLDVLPDEAIASIVAYAKSRPGPACKIFVEFPGGAIARVPREATAFDHRASPFNLLVIGSGEEPAHDDVNRRWVRETWQAMQPYAAAGVYVNYLGTEADEGSNRVPAAYGPGKLEKLVALKRKYDPGNVFRMNQNIPVEAPVFDRQPMRSLKTYR